MNRPHTGREGRLSADGTGDAKPVLDVRDLVKHFRLRGTTLGWGGGELHAVDGVSFSIWSGETLGLVGESGSGKSTTACLVLRLVEPDSGVVRFRDRDVLAMKGRDLRAFRRQAQIVFQDPYASLNPRMTVFQALDEVLRVHGLRGDASGRAVRIAELLERVGLSAERVSRFPHELSGGQRQRVVIARALGVAPTLLICDEPVSALDVSVRAQVVNLLAELQAEMGLTYLFIAHDLALVEHVSDRVAVMFAGRIVELADVASLYRAPQYPYTRELLSALPGAPTRKPGPPAGGTVSRAWMARSHQGCPFFPRCDHPERNEECRAAVPPLQERGRGHQVACWKVGHTPSVGRGQAPGGA